MPNETTQISELVREIYEKRPYPSTTGPSEPWSLVPLPWISALSHDSENVEYKRVLIAGCGMGDEAFRMRRAQPTAEIVAIDFSRRSIALARRLAAQSADFRSVQFEVADLAKRGLDKLTGRGFDFISCHGVLSYIPRPEAALRNLARCLKPGGVLYLGVNGIRHLSVPLRQTLPLFGFDMAVMKDDDPGLRKVLRLCDEIAGRVGAHRVAKFKPELLAGDVFGPLILNWPLAKWVRLARRVGLHFQGSYYGWRAMRSVIAADNARLLPPRSRAEICQIADVVSPTSFHRAIFAREPEANPPWRDLKALGKWSPHRTHLYREQIPEPSRSLRSLRTFPVTSPSTNTRLNWCLPEWTLQILRQANGQCALDEILSELAVAVPASLVGRHLYLLHQLLVVKLMPPRSSGRRRRENR